MLANLYFYSVLLLLVVVCHKSTSDSRCSTGPADVGFLIDGSSSVDAREWNQTLDFVNSMVRRLDVGVNRVQIGLISFSWKAKLVFPFNKYSTRRAVQRAVTRSPKYNRASRINNALFMALHSLFNAKNGMRPGVPNICVIITDGKSPSPKETMNAAAALHRLGVQMFVVGVLGHRASLDETFALASKPSYVYKYPDFDNLKLQQDTSQLEICRAINYMAPTGKAKSSAPRATTKPTTTTPTTTLPTTTTSTTTTPSTTTTTSTTSTTTVPTTTTSKSTTPSTTTLLTTTTIPTTKTTPTCPHNITTVASPTSRLGTFDLNIGGKKHQLKLPIGTYSYDVYQEGMNCSQSVTILDPDVVRRIVFRAYYDVDCKVISNPISRATLASVAESSFNEIQSVCDKDCVGDSSIEALLSCSADKLKITWSTNQTYRGDITAIPAQLYSRLTTRLKQMGVGFLKIVVVNRNPPIAYATRVDILLSSSCLNNKFYTEKGDRCE